MKFLYRWPVVTFLWLLFWIPVYILGYFVTWIGLLFCNRGSEHMPVLWWLWDNCLGINGTINYNNLKWPYTCNKKAIDKEAALTGRNVWDVTKSWVDMQTGKERSYGKRWIWVTFRNPVSNLTRGFLGRKMSADQPITTKTWKFLNVHVRRDEVGFLLWQYEVDFYWNSKKAFQYIIGWKVTDLGAGGGDHAVFMYRISPFRTMS